MNGKFQGWLRVDYINGREWRVVNDSQQPFRFVLDTGESIIPEDGFIMDFASIPRFFWRILPPVGDGSRARYGIAASIHDWLYKTRKIENQKNPGWNRLCCRDEADRIFLAAMVAVDVEPWKRNVMYKAVKWFGFAAWNKHRKAEKQ